MTRPECRRVCGSSSPCEPLWGQDARARAATCDRSQRKFTRKELTDTFWHEVTHAILRDMDHPLWCSEKFVTDFARRMIEIVLTAELP